MWGIGEGDEGKMDEEKKKKALSARSDHGRASGGFAKCDSPYLSELDWIGLDWNGLGGDWKSAMMEDKRRSVT